MNRLGHRPELDGVRGLAIIMVVAGHCLSVYEGWAQRGVLGVDLFFVLSGFLITSLLVEEWQRDRSVNLREFYIRRGRRLFPALVVLVGVFAFLTLLALPARASETGIEALLRVCFIADFLIAFTQNGVGVGFAHLWSLSLEEQFYLLWPPALLLLLRRRVSPSHLLLVLLVVIAAVNLQRLAVDCRGRRPPPHLVSSGHPQRRDRLRVRGGTRVEVPPASHSGDKVGLGARWSRLLGGVHRLRPAPDEHVPRHAAALCARQRCRNHPVDRQPGRATSAPLRDAADAGDGKGQLQPVSVARAPTIVFFGIIGLPVAVLASVLSYQYVEKPFRRRSRPPIALSAPARAR